MDGEPALVQRRALDPRRGCSQRENTSARSVAIVPWVKQDWKAREVVGLRSRWRGPNVGSLLGAGGRGSSRQTRAASWCVCACECVCAGVGVGVGGGHGHWTMGMGMRHWVG